jgi:hypothetical protein
MGIRLRGAIGVDNMMWGSDYPHSESTFPQSRKILARSWPGYRTTNRPRWPPAPACTNFHVARLSDPTRTYVRMGLASIGAISGMDSTSMPVAEGSSAIRRERPP